MMLSNLLACIACAVAVFSNCEVFGLSMRGSVSVVKLVDDVVRVGLWHFSSC